MPKQSKSRTGTREWAVQNVNCCFGCSNACIYCYARQVALRFKRIKNGEEWAKERINAKARTRNYPKYRGTVMFPSSHDITPGNHKACESALDRLLVARNQVLIVSKARLDLAQSLLSPYMGRGPAWNITFRVTMTHMSRRIGDFWEPHAPTYTERLAALCWAHSHGFATSVSCEPLLEAGRVEELVAQVDQYVTDTIWIGAANQLRARTAWCLGPDDLATLHVEAGQTKAAMRKVYEALKDNPKIRWKDSYRQALDLPAPEESG